MSSWKLLHKLTAFWAAIDNPIFWRETFRPPIWQGITAQAARVSGLTLALAGVFCYLNTLLVFYVHSLLVLLVPIFVLWTVLIGLTLGPAIVRERELGTWEILRSTSLSLEDIILGKAAGGLWWLRHMLQTLSGLVVLIAIVLGLGSLILTPSDFDLGPLSVPSEAVCTMALLLPLITAILFIADRAQQFVLMVTAALAVSTSSSTVRVALPAASVATILVWLTDIGLAVIVLAAQPDAALGRMGRPVLTLSTLGPTVAYLSMLSLDRMLICVALTLIAREIAIRVIWRWAFNKANQM
jgi:hypothetical protein